MFIDKETVPEYHWSHENWTNIAQAGEFVFYDVMVVNISLLILAKYAAKNASLYIL